MDPINTVSQVPPANKTSLLFKFALIALLFSLVAAGIYLVWAKVIPGLTKKACTMEAKVCPDGTSVGRVVPSCDFAPCPTSSPSATIDPIANWKTYTYQIFTIKFPLDWSITSVKNPIQFLNYTPDPKSGGEFNPSTDKGKLKVEIYQKSTSDSLESYLTQQKSSAIEARGNEINWQETKTVVAGKEAVRVKTTTPGFTYNFKDVSSNTIFSIAFALDFDNYRELSDQILSTFKFLEATPSAAPQL